MIMTDETLMAFLDDELSAKDKAKVITRIETSPGLARRIENMRLADTLLIQTCHQIDNDPLPREMMALLEAFPDKQAKPVSADQATILPFRKLRQIAHAPLWQMAVAATIVLVIGLGAGRQLLIPSADRAPKTIMAQLAANIIRPDNVLFPILEKQPSSSAITIRVREDAVVTPIMTFRAANNGYCREFKVMTRQTATRTVACRAKNGGRDAWVVKTSVATQNKISAGEGQYQTATGPDNSRVDTVILGLMKGDALGTEQEARLIQNGWHQK